MSAAKLLTFYPKAPRNDSAPAKNFFPSAAAAKEDRSLDEVADIAQKYADSMATIAVAARCATHPANGSEFGNLGDVDMEIGMGQHGEGGGGRQPMKTAQETR